MISLWRRLNGQQYSFVLANTFISILTFGRNLVFIRTLSLPELGQITLLQTIVMLAGLLPFGLVNGAFIVYSRRDESLNRKIVNLLSLISLSALIIALAVAGITGVVPFHGLVWQETLAFGMVVGVLAMTSNWLNNALVAEGMLASSNLVNFVAISISLLVAFLSRPFGFNAALVSILLQPLIAVVGAMLLDFRLRPTGLRPDADVAWELLRLGVFPFLGMLLVALTSQIERWSIAVLISPEALGRYYLVLMFGTFFPLVPSSLLNVHLPNAIRAIREKETSSFASLIRRHAIELGSYIVATLVVTALALPWFVETIFPKFVGTIHLVYLIFPALALVQMRDNVSLLLYPLHEMKPVLWAHGTAVLCLVVLIVGMATLGDGLTLEEMAIARGVAQVLPVLYLLRLRQIRLRRILQCQA